MVPEIKFTSINQVYPVITDGKYQVASILLVCLSMIPVSIQQYVMIFVALPPSWKYLNATKIMFSRNEDYDNKCSNNRSQWEWIEEKSFSIITEFNLHCDQESLIHTTTMLYFGMAVFGANLIGSCSDRYGRKKTMVAAGFINIMCTVICALSVNVAMFMVFKILIGLFSPGLLMVIVSYCVEVVSEKKRTSASMVVWIFYTTGALIVALTSYLVNNWRILLLCSSVPYLAIVALLCFLPESIAWEFNKNKDKIILKKIRNIYKVNHGGKKLAGNIVIDIPTKCHKEERIQLMLLWKPYSMAVKTMFLGFSWIFLAASYMGMSYAAENVTGNIYRDFVILTGVDIPACFIAIFLSKRFGHKLTVITSVIAAGICLVVVGILPGESQITIYTYSRLFFGVLGKLLAAIGTDCIFSWTTETYPTFLRSTASGFFLSCSYIGTMITPWVAVWLNRYHPSIPFYTMGGLLLASAAMLIKIDETSEKPLAESL